MKEQITIKRYVITRSWKKRLFKGSPFYQNRYDTKLVTFSKLKALFYMYMYRFFRIKGEFKLYEQDYLVK